MRDFEYCAPTQIVFGDGAENKAGQLLKKDGAKRVLIVYGSDRVRKSGLLGRVEQSIEAEGLEVTSCGGVQPNPLLSKVRELIAAARETQADFLLAIGGGSVIDTAKAVSLGACMTEGDVWDYWTKKRTPVRNLPVGSILTIAAAGSETSNSAVITNDEGAEPTKRGLSVELNRPRFTLMDPRLTMSLPVWQIGAGASDIFMHTAERYFTTILGNHLTDEIAEGLFRDIVKYGKKAVIDPQDYEAMSEVMWCGSVSHSGLTGIGAKGNTARDGDWSCHQLGMAISALYGSTHGATLTAVFGAWARDVCAENYDRFAQLGNRVFGVDSLNTKMAAIETIAKIGDFFAGLGMPLTLTELLGHRPTDKELTALAEECTYGRTRTIGTFKQLDYEEILHIFTKAV